MVSLVQSDCKMQEVFFSSKKLYVGITNVFQNVSYFSTFGSTLVKVLKFIKKIVFSVKKYLNHWVNELNNVADKTFFKIFYTRG